MTKKGLDDMGDVDSLLEARGKSGAITAGVDRDVIEAASAYVSDEDSSLGFAFSGWAQCALPHRRLAPEDRWEIAGEHIRLVIEPARLILLFLQTEALRTNSREIELGRSLRHWLGRIGASIGGTNARAVRDQAERISLCRLTFHIHGSGRVGLVNQSIVDRALFIDDELSSGQGRLSLETAKLRVISHRDNVI